MNMGHRGHENERNGCKCAEIETWKLKIDWVCGHRLDIR